MGIGPIISIFAFSVALLAMAHYAYSHIMGDEE